MDLMESNLIELQTATVEEIELPIFVPEQEQEVVIETTTEVPTPISTTITTIPATNIITTTTTTKTTCTTTSCTTTTCTTPTCTTTTSTTPFCTTSTTTSVAVKPPHKKQKRKEALITLPLSDEDLELEFQIVEEPPQVEIIEVRRKPRKEYRTKKKLLLAMESNKDEEPKKDEVKKEDMKREEIKKEEVKKDEAKEDEAKRDEPKKGVRTKGVKRELPKRERTPQPQSQPQSQPQAPQLERRTRLSNACRVATGKSYKCNDCDFSTDRINNIIHHVKESCPKLKKT